MKIHFRRLGPIRKAELELGDLTIVAGRNNTGKTYLAYTLYGFLKMWEEIAQRQSGGRARVEIEDLIKKAVVEGQARGQIERDALVQERETLIQAVSAEFSTQALVDVFSSSGDVFERATIDIELDSDFPEDQSFEITLPTGGGLSISIDGSEIAVVCTTAVARSISDSQASAICLRFLLPELSLDPFLLSSERFGISLFYKELDFTKSRVMDLIQQVGRAQAKTVTLPYRLIDNISSRYSLPIKDNIDFARRISFLQKDKSEIFESKLSDEIKEMMAGYYSSSGDDIRFRSKSRKDHSFNIPLHQASSSARGLSDLYFFLRHLAHRNHLLIIDEPESHLDTANQIQLARLLARLAKAGVKVLVTTHSDYLIKEINNLLMLSRSFESKSKLIKTLKYKNDDFLEPDSVRAYVAEKNSLNPCVIDQFGIDMPVFDRTIHDINRAANELASKLMVEEEEK